MPIVYIGTLSNCQGFVLLDRDDDGAFPTNEVTSCETLPVVLLLATERVAASNHRLAFPVQIR
jgi:hypothetical protein